jgi:hypothetical protein
LHQWNTTNTAFLSPTNPGNAPVLPGEATGPQILAIICQHTHHTNIFQEYLATNKALKQQQVIRAVNNIMYLRTLSHRITGLANVLNKQMLTHLYNQYGRPSAQLISKKTMPK